MQVATKLVAQQVYDNNEEAIIHAFRDGDKDAFREVYDKMVRPLTYYVENIIFSTVDAEDIVASAFSKLYNARTGMRSVEHIKRWLYVIVRNESIDYLRLRSRLRESHSEVAYLEAESDDQHETERVKSALFQDVLSEIEKLPRQRRTILRLYFFEQKTTAEIAQLMGLNTQTVLNHKAKALDSLRKTGMKLKWLVNGIPSFLFALVITLHLVK
jgi:RNA polymerase sigma factor (sigma-70 family)